MDWGTLLFWAGVYTLFQAGTRTNNQFDTSYMIIQWHYFYTGIPWTSQPETKAAFYNGTLNIFYLGKTAQSTNLYQFNGPKQSLLGLNSRIDGLIYDENSGQVHTNLPATYPRLIAVNATDAYFLNDTTQWIQNCTKCINSNITNSNAEIFLSHDKTFWASFDDSRRIITSKDFRQWAPRGNAESNTLHNIFPILNPKSEPKWVLVYLNTVSPEYSYYSYNIGTISYETGFTKELGPFNLTCGHANQELFFATKGDDVNQFQYLIPTLVNVMDGKNGLPVILNTPRQVLFKEISGQQVLVQQPLLTADKMPISYRYQFDNRLFGYGIQERVLSALGSTSFIMTVELKLDSSQEVGIFVRMSQDETERTGIGYLAEGIFYVGQDTDPNTKRNYNGTVLNTFKNSFEAKLTPTVPSGNPTFLIYVDGPLVEVFCDNNQVNFNLIVLAKVDSYRMGLYTSRNRSATLISFDMITYDH